MSTAVLPDITGALVGRLRQLPEALALVSTPEGYKPDARPNEVVRPRISPERQAFWAMPCEAIWVNGPIGNPNPADALVGIMWARFDVVYYGSNGYKAGLLCRTVHPLLCPRQGMPAGFTVDGCRVGMVVPEGGPNRVVDPATGWPSYVATYLFQYLAEAVP